MSRAIVSCSTCWAVLVLYLSSGACVKGGTFDPVDGPGRLLSPDRILLAEGTVRAKGYDVNDINKLRLAVTDVGLKVRQDALIVLTHRYPRDAIPMLRQALDDRSSLIRCTAARMLGALGDQSGLDRMRRDMDELKRPQQVAGPSEGRNESGQVKRSIARSADQRLYDALEAAEVLAEFGDSSGYGLAAQAALQNRLPAVRSMAVAVLANIGGMDQATLNAKGCDPEAVLLEVVRSETKPSVLGMVADCAMSRMKRQSQIRVLEAIERSPHLSTLTSLHRQAIKDGLIHARKQIEQEESDSHRKGD